jgi:acetyl esterase/lipase
MSRWLGLLAVVMALPARADETPITAANDLAYTKVGDQELKLDLARPAAGEGPFPAVVVIHGGAWRAGDKADNRRLLTEFAKRGYVAISPQYRFCPRETFPAQVHDVKAAVRWLRQHAGEYRVDPERIGATGFSAGGHLSLMLGMTGPDDGLEGDVPADAPSSRVQAVVNYFGPTELGAADIPEVSRPLVKDFLGGTPSEKPEATKQASPVTFASEDDPPILTFQGTKDPLVPHTQAFKLADALTAAGAPGRVELLVGAGHGWGGDDLQRTLAETFAFFDKYLKK